MATEKPNLQKTPLFGGKRAHPGRYSHSKAFHYAEFAEHYQRKLLEKGIKMNRRQCIVILRTAISTIMELALKKPVSFTGIGKFYIRKCKSKKKEYKGPIYRFKYYASPKIEQILSGVYDIPIKYRKWTGPDKKQTGEEETNTDTFTTLKDSEGNISVTSIDDEFSEIFEDVDEIKSDENSIIDLEDDFLF